MVTEIKSGESAKNWFKRHWILSIFLGIIALGMISTIFNNLTGDDNLTGNVVNEGDDFDNNGNLLIKSPDTKEILFELTGNEKIYGIELCGDKKTFSTDVTLKRFGINLPNYCDSVISFDITNYCSLGNKKGENVMMYYSRPIRYIDCKVISSSGEILDIKRYGIKKELKLINEEQISENCANATFQLVNIIIE